MPEKEALKQYISQLKPTLMGKFFYYCIPFRRQVVLNNMQHVFADKLNNADIVKLAQSFYSHIATSLKENLQMRFLSYEQQCKRIEVVGYEPLIEIVKDKGILILTGHLGNWEFAPVAGIKKFKQFKGRFHFIRKNLRFKWLEQLLFRRYYKAGLHVIPKKNSLDPVCDALEQKDAVVFVLDQHASLVSKDGIMVDFFGKPAGTYRSLAMIASYTDIPVVPAASYRKKDGKHVLKFYPPLAWQKADKARREIELNTLAYNQVLEKMIMLHPEQWLWMHKRWKPQ